MAQQYVCLAVTCSSELEALMVVYLSVCCHITSKQIQARVSPVNPKAADVLWPAALDQGLINRADPNLQIESIRTFQISGSDSFPDVEQTRIAILRSLREHLAA